jgi:hypothetical protein
MHGAVDREFVRAQEKHGTTRSIAGLAAGDPLWLAILVEEVGEASKALAEEGPARHLHDELIQVAAVALGWAEAIRTGRRAEP